MGKAGGHKISDGDWGTVQILIYPAGTMIPRVKQPQPVISSTRDLDQSVPFRRAVMTGSQHESTPGEQYETGAKRNLRYVKQQVRGFTINRPQEGIRNDALETSGGAR